MARRGTAETLSSDVYERLRDSILTGRIAPSERLPPSALAKEFSVSLSVIREALTRLSEQRLVVASPNLGFSVAPLSREHLDQLVEARCLIEAHTIRESVAHGDLHWESQVVAAHYRLNNLPTWTADGDSQTPVPNPEWVTAHAEFHATLLAASPNAILREVCASLYDAAELYRRWNRPQAVTTDNRDVRREHTELADAVRSHDGDLAAALLTRHIRLTRDYAIASIPALSDDNE